MMLKVIKEFNRAKLVVDDEVWRTVSLKTFRSILHVAEGKSFEEVKALFEKEEPRLALKIAAKILDRTPLPSEQLKKRLCRRGFCEEVAVGAAQRFVDEGIISDLEWAKSYARIRLQKGYGKRRVEQELKHKGLNIPIEFDGEKERLQGVIERRYSNIQDAKERGRAISSLCHRGFDLEMVLACLPHVSS